MAITIGSRIGSYEITAQIGVGGMGEVYRATDTNLGRQVAIKVLPEAFAQDADRLARFEREAKTLASLNHPNIAQIHGFAKADGIRALVMELVEGPTLADRIAQGPIPVDEALPIAKQIAEALEAAHEQGIIHRDLKPANIKLRPDGVVKVLDFGLAKALEPMSGAIDATASPTITSPAVVTGVGVLLGTAAYMSPEQARGKPVDKRADISAFGCVLFEMLTGKRAFEDEDVSMTLSKVLQREPNFEAFPSAPPRVRQTIRMCLRKFSKERIADIHDVRLALEGAFDIEAAHAAPSVAVAPPVWQRPLVAAGVTAIVAILATGLATWKLWRPGPLQVVRTDFTTRAAAALFVTPATRDIAVTPDGTRVVYVGNNGTQLFVWALDQLEPMPLGPTGIPPHGVSDHRQHLVQCQG